MPTATAEHAAPSHTVRSPHGVSPFLLAVMAAGGAVLGLLSLLALARATLGLAPAAPAAREVAVAVHLGSVVPAIPLGLFVLLTRKGGARHRLLGRVWMGLMVSTALSALFIRHLNHGGFSWIHIFVPATLVAAWAAIAAARAGDIAQHRNRLAGMFLGALVVPVCSPLHRGG